MNLPTKEECESLLDEFELPQNIRDHIKLVTNIAVFLAKELEKKGEKLDINLIETAASLHDMDKLKWQIKHENHGDMAYDILVEKGYDEKLAHMVRYHGGENQHIKLDGWELKILRYADSRAIGDSFCSIGERMNDLKRRFEYWRSEWFSGPIVAATKNIENDIFSRLDFKPEELELMMKNAC
jgi:putative nucleotidyltransferase with HDIG domain